MLDFFLFEFTIYIIKMNLNYTRILHTGEFLLANITNKCGHLLPKSYSYVYRLLFFLSQ